MTDTVQTNTIFEGSRRKVAQFLNASDGTGESAVAKFDASNDSDADHYSIQEIEYDIQGFTGVKIYFDADADDEAIYLPAGSGFKTFVASGGLRDPKSTGYTGDIVFTTVGGSSTSTYDILVHVKKHAA